MESTPRFDYCIKLIVIGDSDVGKTSILVKFTDEQFKSTHITTVGIDFKIKTMKIDDKVVKVQVWDTAG